MRIYKNKFYILQSTPGISGFQRWDEREYRLCTGHKAAFNRLSVIKEFRADNAARFRLEDGHLPNHQPYANAHEAIAWVAENRYQTAYWLNPKEYGLKTRGFNA